eukprot:scaffold48_cov311-Pinguiococcus_pyrenoidosus.AAC.121
METSFATCRIWLVRPCHRAEAGRTEADDANRADRLPGSSTARKEKLRQAPHLARDGAPGGVAYLGRLPLQTEQHAEDAAHCPRKGFRPDGVVRPAESDGVGHGQAEEVLVDRLKVPIVLVNLPDQVVLVCARKALQRIALDDVAEEDVILRVFRLGQLPLEQLNVVRGGLHEHRRLQVAHGFVRSAWRRTQMSLRWPQGMDSFTAASHLQNRAISADNLRGIRRRTPSYAFFFGGGGGNRRRLTELFDQVHLLLEDLALRVHHGAHSFRHVVQHQDLHPADALIGDNLVHIAPDGVDEASGSRHDAGHAAPLREAARCKLGERGCGDDRSEAWRRMRLRREEERGRRIGRRFPPRTDRVVICLLLPSIVLSPLSPRTQVFHVILIHLHRTM